jgi:RNA polymerase sigma-70 factor, ECF subfamily
MHDPERFGAALAATRPELKRYALRLASDPDEAADLVQETMVRGWQARESFTPGTNLAAWLTRIMRNHFLAQLRSRRRLVRDTDGVYAAARTVEAPQDYAVVVAELRRTLERMPKVYSEALVMAALGDSYEELAETVGAAVGTIKSRVSRARRALGANFAL